MRSILHGIGTGLISSRYKIIKMADVYGENAS